VNVIDLRWILTSSNGLMNSISKSKEIIKNELMNTNNENK
jgi:hypothetical protein